MAGPPYVPILTCQAKHFRLLVSQTLNVPLQRVRLTTLAHDHGGVNIRYRPDRVLHFPIALHWSRGTAVDAGGGLDITGGDG